MNHPILANHADDVVAHRSHHAREHHRQHPAGGRIRYGDQRKTLRSKSEDFTVQPDLWSTDRSYPIVRFVPRRQRRRPLRLQSVGDSGSHRQISHQLSLFGQFVLWERSLLVMLARVSRMYAD